MAARFGEQSVRFRRHTKRMTNMPTHFEIYGEEPARLAEFYRTVFGWQVEQMSGVDYWRIQVPPNDTNAMRGGLTYRAIPDFYGWLLFVNVDSLDETTTLVQRLGGSVVRPKTAVPKTAWITIVADP